MKERIKEIMRAAKVTTDSQFAKIIGIKQAALSHILTGKNNPSLDVIMKINQAYPGVNLEWLLYGKGEMGNVENNNSVNGEAGTELPFMDFPANESEVSPQSKLEPIPQTIEKVKYVERPPRKITEVRIFYDDGTYETLIPANS